MIYYGLIGAGGHGRETMPVLAEMIQSTKKTQDYSLTFVVEGTNFPSQINGYSVISLDDFLAKKGDRYFNIAIANAETRQRIATQCILAGLKPLPIISKSALMLEANQIGEGIMLSPYAVITSNTRIGHFFHANIHSRVAHDCVIGDFVTFGPNVQCNGNVIIEDYAYIGTSAILKNGTKQNPLIIGKGACVGMGAVVTKNVPPFTTVIGNPAKPLVK